MTRHESFLPSQGADTAAQIVKLAILAVGGQGGGVLTSWVEATARAQGRAVQATSVAGVAQRTGATIYYIEIAPEGVTDAVFSLAPAAGDIDVLVAAEMMEAGRAIQRGFVTPDRTTLIASTHRALAVSEKMVPGDGIADADEVRAAADIAARRVIMADMDRLAVEKGSVISASLLGALAGSETLPFPREAFEDAIRASGKGVEASLRAFAAGFDAARGGIDAAPAAPERPQPRVSGPARALRDWEALLDRARALPAPVAEMAEPGLRKVVNFQDCAYGEAYLDRLDTVIRADSAGRDWQLSREAAKYVANAMAYDDMIRVADLKTRAGRAARIRGEMNAGDGKLMHVTEFLHPRAEEIAGLMPARLGAWFEAKPARMAWLDRRFNKGRRMRSDSLTGFLPLYLLGGMKGWRLRTLRHRIEAEHLERWLSTALARAPKNYDLAVETIRCRRLIKGYSDTHARGLSKFDRVMEGIALVESREDAADWARRLREAALKDEEGKSLDGALATIRSFA